MWGSSRARRCRGVVVGGLLLTGMGLGIAPAHAAVDGRCTVAATPSVTYRIASPTVVREGPADACVRVVDGRTVDAPILRTLLADKALVAVPRATPRPAPVVPPTAAPKPPASTSPPPTSSSTPAPTAPGSTAPATPPASTPAGTTPTGTTPAGPLPTTGSAVPGAPALPSTTPPAGTAPAGTPDALPGRPALVPGTTGPTLPSVVAPRSPAAASSDAATLLAPGGTPAAGDRLGVDLLAPVGGAPVLEGDPDAPLVAPAPAEAPETVLLRTLGESDPTGVHSATTAEALAAGHRPGLLSAAVGAAILAALAGFAVRHRVLSRYRRWSVASGPRLVEVSVRSRPDA